MSRIKFLSVSVLLALVLSTAPTMALTGLSAPSATPCTGKGTAEELRALATLIVNDELTEEAISCYQALSDASKAQLFEVIAIERGISVAELHEEARKDVEAMRRIRDSNSTPLGYWQQLIERSWTSLG